MKNIGVILPCTEDKRNFILRFFKNFRCKRLHIEEYGFDFVVVNTGQNFRKILKKNNVEYVVVMTDCDIGELNFKILDGRKTFLKMLPEYIRKTAKKYGGNCSVTLVDKYLSPDGMIIADKLCEMCRSVNINTLMVGEAEKLCDSLLDKYGIAVNVIGENENINSDMAVVLGDCGNNYSENCIVIDNNPNNQSLGVIKDFYIRFRTKPPFGMSNLIFAECIEVINC